MTDPRNSTNVRPHAERTTAAPVPASAAFVLGARRAALHGLARFVSTEAAARYAVRLFSTPRKHARPVRETEALGGARRTRIAHAGKSLPVWTWGADDAPAVLLVHGWEGRGAQLAAFVPSLVGLGLRVVAFDAPGHGEAEAPRDNLVEHARAVLAVAAHAGDVRLVVAHSMGAAATLLATRFGLRAHAYALLAPPTSPVPWVEGFARAYALSDELKGAMMGRIESHVGIRFSALDARIDARALEAPLLVVHDEDDREVPCTEGKRLVDAARDARLVATRGLGHRRVLRAPEVVSEVQAFAAAFAVPRTSGPGRARAAATFGGASLDAALDAELFFRDERWAV